MFSNTDIAIFAAVIVGALCVAVYEAWLDPFQAIAVMVILVAVVVGVKVFS